MNNIEKEIKLTDGTTETLIITSNDNYELKMGKTYKLANYNKKKENKLVNKFKNSILGTEVGLAANGFSNIAILATIIAVGAVCIMYVFCRV